MPNNETPVFPFPFRRKENLEGDMRNNYLSFVKAMGRKCQLKLPLLLQFVPSADALISVLVHLLVSANLWPDSEHKVDLLMGCGSRFG